MAALAASVVDGHQDGLDRRDCARGRADMRPFAIDALWPEILRFGRADILSRQS